MAISFVVARGLICCQRRRSGIKIALVVGHKEDDMRVCFWRAASAQWTKPAVVSAQDLDHLLNADVQKHERTILRAAKAAVDKKLVARVWSSEGVVLS